MADPLQALGVGGTMLNGLSNAGTAGAKLIYTEFDLNELYKEVEIGIQDLRSKQKVKLLEAGEKLSTHDINPDYKNWIEDFSKDDCDMAESLPRYKIRIEATSWFHFIARFNVAKGMNNYKTRISALSQRFNNLRNILVLKEPKQVVEKTDVPDIKDFKTLEEPLNNIINLLNKREVKGIELRGILGTGKSTIMQNLNNRREVAQMFDIVIWLDVSSDTTMNGKNFSLEKLQRDVMLRLNLLDDLAHEHLYKQNISGKLVGKRYLLLLDGVKESLKIDDIGFPDPSEKDSKVVLTSRKKNVFHSLDTHPVEVTQLTKEEAKIMFLANLEPLSEYNQKIRNLVPKVLQWCDRLPAAIKIVAGYFKSRTSEDSWRTGIYSLYHCWLQQIDDVTEEMFGRLKFCCEYLKDADKNCFYHSALYAEESRIYIDRLLDCWVALDFCATREDGRNALERLNDQNLFQEDERNIYVRINKLIRLVALHNLQTHGKHKFLVLSNKESLDQQDMESWKEKHWISLADNKNLKTITGKPDCSVLSTLFLQGNSNFKELPDNFFQQMGSLCVLDVMGTGITSLPNFSTNVEPTKLKVLYLNGCTNLVGLPSEIGKLTLLEVLDISGCGVELKRPPQIQSLKYLKRLVLSSHAFSIVCVVISDLAKLQEILIDTKSNKDMYNWGINVLVMESVKDLIHLTSVQFRFLNDEVVDVIKVVDDVTRIYAQKEDDLINFVQKDGLDSFEVFIGCQISPDLSIPKSEYIYRRYVKYYNDKGRSPAFLKFLPGANSLVIDNCDLKHLSALLNSSTVICFLLKNCRIITHIYGNQPILSNLERLHLSDLQELKSMWVEFSECSIPKLKTLVLTRCPKLTVLITQDAVDKIQLQCNAGQKLQVFPDLMELILVEMLNMTSICEDVALDWLSLKSVEISKSPILCSLPFSRSNAINLASIKAEENWFEALTWTNDSDKQHFQGHCTFV